MRYAIVIETGTEREAYGVVVPDLPGCFSAGDTLDEALANSKEAILLHIEGLLEENKPIPAASDLESLRARRKYRNRTWAVVDVDLSDLGDKFARVNITIPRRILRAVDSHARRHGESRSGFLARAAMQAMRRSGRSSL